MNNTALVALIVVQSMIFCGIVTWGAWLIFGRATQAARYDLDAAQQALRMSEVIDNKVRARLSIMRFMVDKDGNVIDAEGKVQEGANRGFRLAGQQPTDANVQQRSIIDDLHETEREADRVIGDAEFTNRDNFVQPRANNQPIEA